LSKQEVTVPFEVYIIMDFILLGKFNDLYQN
jgi:hypothetical protein